MLAWCSNSTIVLCSKIQLLNMCDRTLIVIIFVVQLLSHVQLYAIPQTEGHQAPLSSTIFQSLFKFMSNDSVIYLAISLSVTPFSFCPQSFLASESFPMSKLFALVAKIWASASVLPVNIQGCFPLVLTGLMSLQLKGFSRIFSSTTIQNINSLVLSIHYGPTLTSAHDYWKNHSFDYTDICWQSDISAFWYTF